MNFNLNKLISIFAISLALLLFVSAVGYSVVYNDANNAGIFNQTNITSNLGISLLKNSNAYNFTSGDFSSFVFYNSTTTFWNLTLAIADSFSPKNGVVNNNGINLSDPNLVSYWAFDSGLGLSDDFVMKDLSRNNNTGIMNGKWFTKQNSGNPVLTVSPGKFDNYRAICANVIFNGTGYQMWYGGYNNSNYQIGYATSSEGITWTKQNSGNPVMTFSIGKFDSIHVYCPDVIFNGTGYQMWYSGHNGSSWQIGYATSSDGLTWTKQNSGNAVLTVSPGKFDNLHAFGSSVLFNGTTYQMWYSGHNTSNYQIGYATSSDGLTWTKQNSGNPVLTNGAVGKFDNTHAYSPNVIFNGTTYQMWYTGFGVTTNYNIGYATSSDGLTWTKQNSGNPVLTNSTGYFDSLYLYYADIIFNGTTYQMWYTGDNGTWMQTGYATSNSPFTTGISSTAVSFNGRGDKIIVDNASNLNFGKGNFSISLWMYPISGNTYFGIAGKDVYVGANYSGYFLQYNPDQSTKKIRFATRNSTQGVGTYMDSNSSVNLNSWSHIVAVRNSTQLYVYINGVFDKNQNESSLSDVNSNTTFQIGQFESSANTLNGSIDEVLIYNKSLSSQEVSALFKAGLSGHATTNITLQTRTANSYNISDVGLVALWGLNNASGESATLFKDELGRNNGSCSGSTCPTLNSSGVVANAMIFDGGSDYLSFGNSTILNPLSKVTLSFWMKTANSSAFSDFALIVGKTLGGGSQVHQYSVHEILGDSKIIWALGNGTNSTQLKSVSPVNTQQWVFVTGTYDSSSLSSKLYINGVLENSTNNALTGLYASSANFSIGFGNYGFFNGSIDELRIYNRSLSASEVYNLYQLGSYHLNWNEGNDWTNTTIVSDGVSQTTSSYGKYMQFKTNFATNTSSVSPFLINHSAITFNSAPNIASVIISSANSSRNESLQNLTAIVFSSDINGDNITFAYNWYKNGILNATSLITDGLVAYYPLNNDTLDYWSGNDGILNSAPINNNTNGKVGNGYGFDGVDDAINFSSSILPISAGTISVWFKPAFDWDNSETWHVFADINNCLTIDSVNQMTLFYDINANNINLAFDNGTTRPGLRISVDVDTNWTNIVYTYNGSKIRGYLNGNFNSELNHTDSLPKIYSDNLFFGRLKSGQFLYNGSLDEVMIFNRSLSALEIKMLYEGSKYGGKTFDGNNTRWQDNVTVGIRGGDYISFASEVNSSNNINILDFTSSIATLVSPIANSYSNNSTQNLTAILTDESSGIKNASLYINGVYNQTITFAQNIYTTTLGITLTFVDGIYSWFYQVFDFAGNSYLTGNQTFIIDITYPLINFTNPTLNNYEAVNNGVMTANVSITELNLANITWNFNGTISSINNLYNPANLTKGLVLLMNFENESSFGENATRVYDFSGTGNNGSCSGATCPKINSSGKFGNAMTFDGIDDYVALNLSLNPAITNFSMGLWFNTNSITATNIMLQQNNGTGMGRTILAVTPTSCPINPSVYTFLNGTLICYNISFNTWYHVIVTYNYSALSVYLNGMLINSSLRIPESANGDYLIGAGKGISSLFNGSIDEVAIWNRSLSAEEVKTLYTNQLRNYPNTNSLYLINNSANVNLSLLIDKNSNSNYLLNITQSGILTGNSYFYNLSATDLAGNTNKTETRNIRGNVAPLFYSINNSPDINATLDPGVNIVITINVSDEDYNLDSVILKWKNSTSTWAQANSTRMLNQTPIYSATIRLSNSTIFNASIPTWNYEHNLSYMVVINDSLGQTINSTIRNLSLLWDCTWTITPTNLGTIGGFNQEKILGEVVFTNTGDNAYSINNCSLKFARNVLGADWYDGSTGYESDGEYLNLSSNYYLKSGTKGLRYYLDSSAVNSISLNVSENKTLIIKGMFVKSNSLLNEYPALQILSNISDTDSSSNNITITAKMIITPGAYLETAFEPASQTVYLTPGNFSIATYVKNVVDASDNPQNNTAYNVGFNVSIPSSLSDLLISGDINRTLEKINNTAKNYSNFTFEFTSENLVSFNVNSYTFYSYTFGYENSTGDMLLISHTNNQSILNATGIINFACYSIKDDICVDSCINISAGLVYDPDCSLPTTTITNTVATTSGGGGGGGGGSVAKSEATLELKRGEASVFYLDFKNKYPGKMKNIKISVSGINSEYILINPNMISSMLGYSTTKIRIKINAPAYFTDKKYTLTFLIEATLDANGIDTPVSERKVVTLYITEVSGIEAIAEINEITNFVNEMNSSSMNIKEISKLLSSMNTDYKEYSFNNVADYYELAKKIYDNAIESKKIIEELYNSIADAENRGLNIIETKKMLYIAESAFDRGDYSLALERLKEAKLTFALETKGEINFAYEIKNNPIQYLSILIGLGLFGLGSSLLIRYQLYKKKLRALKEEQLLLLELMKLIQRECFEKSHLSMEEYEQAMIQYENRLSETIEDRIKIETTIANMFKLKGKRIALGEEKKRLIEMMQNIQKDYLVKGNIETRIYENMMKSYIRRLSEVQEELATIDAEDAVRRQGKVRRMFRVK